MNLVSNKRRKENHQENERKNFEVFITYELNKVWNMNHSPYVHKHQKYLINEMIFFFWGE